MSDMYVLGSVDGDDQENIQTRDCPQIVTSAAEIRDRAARAGGVQIEAHDETASLVCDGYFRGTVRWYAREDSNL
jgi:hypothetical protein